MTIETPQEPKADDDDPTGWKTAERFIGMWKGAPEGEPIARETTRTFLSELRRHH